MFIAKNTKILLVYVIYRYNPEVYRLVIISGINNQAANLQVIDLKTFHKKLAADLVFFTKKIVSYYDRYYNIEPIFKKKKIHLIHRNIQIKQPSTKLDHKKLGLFKIKKITGLVNYELILPKIINIYPVFYIFFLELILLGMLLALVTKIEPIILNTKYKIKEILDYKQVKGQVKYLVK
jgi:hypothetical protein